MVRAFAVVGFRIEERLRVMLGSFSGLGCRQVGVMVVLGRGVIWGAGRWMSALLGGLAVQALR